VRVRPAHDLVTVGNDSHINRLGRCSGTNPLLHHPCRFRKCRSSREVFAEDRRLRPPIAGSQCLDNPILHWTSIVLGTGLWALVALDRCRLGPGQSPVPRDESPTMFSPASAGVVIEIRVIPRASRSCVAGVRDDALLVRLQAPPVEGAANAALIELLADLLRVPRNAISIVGGQSRRNKRVLVTGVTMEHAASILMPRP